MKRKKVLTKKENIRNWKAGLKPKKINIAPQTGMRKGQILT